MPIRLQTLRLYITTRNKKNAETEDLIRFRLDLPGGTKQITLQNSWMPNSLDRRRKQTDAYEISLVDGMTLLATAGATDQVTTTTSSTSDYVPPGTDIESWEALRQLGMYLTTIGTNRWEIYKYHVVALLAELEPLEQGIDAQFAVRFHDWVLLSSRDEPVLMSTQESDHGVEFHRLLINGVFPTQCRFEEALLSFLGARDRPPSMMHRALPQNRDGSRASMKSAPLSTARTPTPTARRNGARR